jgi:hypothetical protein
MSLGYSLLAGRSPSGSAADPNLAFFWANGTKNLQV